MYNRNYSTGFNNFNMGSFITPATRFLLALTGVSFVAQLIFDLMTGGGFTMMFALSRPGIRHLALWQPVTYMFLHGNLWHLLLNMLGLFFFGPETERALGGRRFVRLYLVCGMLGGLGWLLISGAGGICIGASGAVFGVLAAFATLFPDRPITLLVFFVLPVTMRARTMALGLGAITLLLLLSQPGNIAHAAHLIGGLAGWLYVLFVFNRRSRSFDFQPRAWMDDLRWRWARRKFRVVSNSDMPGADKDDNNMPSGTEVDRVLEKISRYGLGELTESEREILQKASRRRRL